jgi:hypothetical protein
MLESMSDRPTPRDLVGILIRTAKAHHAATGGVNPDWPSWYAEHALDEINELLDYEMSVTELASWLEEADRRYRVEEPEESWPKAYATWLLGGDS